MIPQNSISLRQHHSWTGDRTRVMLEILTFLPPWLGASIFLFTLLFALIIYYFTATFDYWKKRGVQYVKPYPFVGSVSSLLGQREHILDFLLDKYRNVRDNETMIGFYQGRKPTLLVCDPDLIKNILVKDFAYFTDHGFKFHEETDPLQALQLFNMNGQRWKDMRIKLTPTFTSGRMKAMLPLIVECGEQLEVQLNKLANTGEAFEAKELMSRYTIDVIGSCAFGIQCDSLNDPDCTFRKMGKKLVEMDFWQGLKAFVVFFLPEVAMRLRLAFMSRELIEFFRTLVRDVIALRAKTGETRKDFMQLLIELKEKGRLSDVPEGDVTQESSTETTESKLTDDEVTAQAMVFFTAGFETSSSLVSFALLELAINSDVQKRVQEDIDVALKQHDGKITYQALQDMTYLDWVIHETLRKYPPAAFLARECTKNYVIPNTEININPGVHIMVPIHAIQNDPKYFPDPEQFNPERFYNEASQKNKFVYMPFGEGPRQCIGNRFALLQSKLGLLMVLRKYDVKADNRTEYPAVICKSQFLLTARSGVWISISPRSEE